MTTPAPAAKNPDLVAFALVRIARHITGRPVGEGHQALIALGLTEQQATAIMARTTG